MSVFSVWKQSLPGTIKEDKSIYPKDTSFVALKESLKNIDKCKAYPKNCSEVTDKGICT